jgi:NAD(P)-dependent dehydrogenase (short-subunit alcohol dehydrogenase family)
MNDIFSLKDRVIVLTGGLGRLGRRYTEFLLSQGARVAVLDRAEAVADRTSDNESQMIVGVDVLSRKSLEEALRSIEDKWETPHGLINNAALDSPPDSPISENGPFEEYPESSWDAVMDVNVKGVFLCCQVFGGAMARAGRGSIINIGSIYGAVSPDQNIYDYRRQRGETFFKPVAYSASKSALYNLTRYLATYWAPRMVRVNTLTLAGVADNQEPAFLEGYLRKVPLGRMAKADDYFGPVGFLLSEASGYMTGADLVVDGGWTAW